MGVLDALRLRRGQADIQAAMTREAAPAIDPSRFPIASPWSSSTLERIVAEDVFGSNLPVNTRAAAMRIPAVVRSRTLLVSTICRLPIVQLGAGERVPRRPAEDADQAAWDQYAEQRRAFDLAQPTWMYRCDDTSPQLRTAWTVDDLVFSGWSCWWRRNGADGFPVAAGRVNQGSWSIDQDNRVVIDGVPQEDNQVILFSGIHEGILSFGRDVLADARTLFDVVRGRLKNPVPVTELHQTEGEPLIQEEQDTLIANWIAGRNRGDNIGYSSPSLEVKTHGTDLDQQLLVEARNAMAVDLARLVGVTAGLVDATTPTASLNYETQTGRNQELVDRDLYAYMTPIAGRLSEDDIVPRGKRATFDLTDLTSLAPAATGSDLQD